MALNWQSHLLDGHKLAKASIRSSSLSLTLDG